MDIHEQMKKIQDEIDFAKAQVRQMRQNRKTLQMEIRKWLDYIERKKEERRTSIRKSMTTQ